jgi:hypothetical protein
MASHGRSDRRRRYGVAMRERRASSAWVHSLFCTVNLQLGVSANPDSLVLSDFF